MAKKARSTRSTRSGGRPAGSRNRQKDEATGRLTRCVACGSTNRGPYTSRTELAHGGVDGQGQAYTHVVWRDTVCTDCGQHRRDRLLENRSPSKK